MGTGPAHPGTLSCCPSHEGREQIPVCCGEKFQLQSQTDVGFKLCSDI